MHGLRSRGGSQPGQRVAEIFQPTLTLTLPPCFAWNYTILRYVSVWGLISRSGSAEVSRTAKRSAMSLCIAFFSSRNLPTCEVQNSYQYPRRTPSVTCFHGASTHLFEHALDLHAWAKRKPSVIRALPPCKET